MVFAATLLFAGRLADLYPPHIVYTVGFFGIGVFYVCILPIQVRVAKLTLQLIISFMHDQYAFFVLRAFRYAVFVSG